MKKLTREEAIDYLEWIRPKKPYTLDRKNVQTAIDMSIEALKRPQDCCFADEECKKNPCKDCGLREGVRKNERSRRNYDESTSICH